MQGATRSYKKVQEGTWRYTEVQEGTRSYNELKGGTRSYKELQGATRRYKELQRGTRSYKEVLQRVVAKFSRHLFAAAEDDIWAVHTLVPTVYVSGVTGIVLIGRLI